MPLDRLLPATTRDERRSLPQLRDERLHAVAALREDLGVALYLRRQQRHGGNPSQVWTIRSGLVRAIAVPDSENDVHVRLSDAGLAEEFLRFLQRADCIVGVGKVEAHAEGIAVPVEVPQAYDEAQARLEVALYLRVWEAVHPGSGAELLDETS